MRLTDQEPEFLHAHGHPGSKAYLAFRCPCSPTCENTISIPFTPMLDGQPCPEFIKCQWQRTGGSTFEDLSLAPSINFHGDKDHGGPCPGWHGFLTNGNLLTC